MDCSVVRKKPGPEREIENRGRPSTYPWNDWLDGEWHTVCWSKFTNSYDAFRMSCYQKARRIGRRVQVQMTSETKASLQFYDVD